MKTALLRAVSHDLSTPLTAMTVQVASLQRQLAGQPTAKTAGLLVEEVARLKRRIDNLLAMARLETGSIAPRPEPIPPADLFRAARENFGAADQLFAVRVDSNCQDVFADPSLALEILVNLVENARRASPPGAPVELVAELDLEDPDKVRLGVLDRGPGIPPPADSSPRGLGLEIARRFAEASGGTVAMQPRSGGGTSAWVSLPSATSPRGGAVAGAAYSRR
jgi:two-component system sensor histidine kinase KdpD